MRLPQLFIKVGKGRFAPVDSSATNKDLYMWDDDKKQIVLCQPRNDEELREYRALVYIPEPKIAGNRMDKSQSE